MSFYKMDQPVSFPSESDVCVVETPDVHCEGAQAQDNLGHPLVYLTMGEEGSVVCPYCSRKFVLIERP